jgi:DNA-binding NtrC family response regulator
MPHQSICTNFSGCGMLSGERLLIVEEEFLIALDIQRVLEGANAQKAVFARNFGEVAAMGDRIGEFDLAIVNPPRPHAGDLAVAQRIVAAGVPVVVCSAFRDSLADTPFAMFEFVGKPFSDDGLLDACRRAMARRQPR